MALEAETEVSTQLLFERKAGKGSHIPAQEHKLVTPMVEAVEVAKVITRSAAPLMANVVVLVVAAAVIRLREQTVCRVATSLHSLDMAVACME